MATDYDETRPEVAEAAEKALTDARQVDGPDAKSVHAELDEVDFAEGEELPGAIVNEELVVQVIPPNTDEFVCAECFTIRHHSQAAIHKDGKTICRDCVNESS